MIILLLSNHSIKTISPIIQKVQQDGLKYFKEGERGIEECVFVFKKEVFDALCQEQIPQYEIEQLLMYVNSYRGKVEMAYAYNDETGRESALGRQNLYINKLKARNTINESTKAELQLCLGSEQYVCLNDYNIWSFIDGYIGEKITNPLGSRMSIEYINAFLRSLKQGDYVDSLEYEVIAPWYLERFPQEAFMSDTKDIDIQKIKDIMIQRNRLLEKRDQGDYNIIAQQIAEYETLLRVMSHYMNFTFDINKAIQGFGDDHALFYLGDDRKEMIQQWQID